MDFSSAGRNRPFSFHCFRIIPWSNQSITANLSSNCPSASIINLYFLLFSPAGYPHRKLCCRDCQYPTKRRLVGKTGSGIIHRDKEFSHIINHEFSIRISISSYAALSVPRFLPSCFRDMDIVSALLVVSCRMVTWKKALSCSCRKRGQLWSIISRKFRF